MASETKQALQSPPGDLQTDELVTSAEDEKNYKGMCISFFVIATICSLIIISIVLLTPDDDSDRFKNARLKIEEIADETFKPKQFDWKWISDHEIVYTNNNGALKLYDIVTNSSLTLVPNTTLSQYNVEKYSVSANKLFILLTYEIKKVFRYTYTAKYNIYNISGETMTPLEAPGGVQELQYAEFGPKGSQIVFIFENNIYYQNSAIDLPRQLVKTGISGTLFNGITDWLYSDVIWHTNRAFWWSNDGNRLCFVSFDDSRVETLKNLKYSINDDNHYVYPEVVNLQYPKAGRTNPFVSLWISDVRSVFNIGSPRRLLQPQEVLGRDHYLTAVSWIDEEQIVAVWMLREQNYSIVSICKSEKGWICEKNYEDNTKKDSNGYGWVEIFDPPLIIPNKAFYLMRLPLNDGSAGTFRQIAIVNINGGKRKFLSFGRNEVTKILAFRTATNTVFYEATIKGSSGERHIFSISNIFSSDQHSPVCLTCNQTQRNCTFNNALFNPIANYYILHCLGMGLPYTEVRSSDDNRVLIVTKPQQNLIELLESRAYPQIRTFTVPIGSYSANVRLILPPVLRENEEQKFPLVVEIGSEPSKQEVTHEFRVNWGTYLASSRDYVYAQIDVRGSRGNGDKYLFEIWHQIGSVELNDYMEVIGYLKNEFHFIDKFRIAILGWSYGGYISALSLSLFDEIFKCGIAVAPITNWLYVDSFTAERYFGSPWAKGSYSLYESTDLAKKAKLFKDKKLFILHGTADDSIHLQHSFLLMKALNKARVIYRSQIYPDANHYMDGSRIHLYLALDSYLNDCLAYEESDSYNSEAEEENLVSQKKSALIEQCWVLRFSAFFELSLREVYALCSGMVISICIIGLLLHILIGGMILTLIQYEFLK